MTDAPAISKNAFKLFRSATPQLLVFTNEKFKLESAYAQQAERPVRPAHIEQFNRDIAGLLSGVYEFSLFGNLDGEFVRLAGVLTAHGAGRPVIEAGLKAWIMALQTLVKRPESDEMTAPLVRLLQSFASLWARAAVTPPPLDGDALRLHEHLISRNRKAAAETVLKLLRDGTTIEQAYQGTLLPALLSIQLRQRQGSLSAAHAQAAADICRYIMYRVLDSIVSEQHLPFRILTACMPGEQDLLGPELFVNYLEVQGWQVLFMRESHTLDDIAESAAQFKPHIALLSAASIQSLPASVELAAIIRQTYPQTRIAMEGRAALLARDQLGSRCDAVVSGFEKGHQSLLNLLSDQP
ncbi:MAG: cobalamin B12-binding domain-containing protein [Deltaproteobacteria bacterium]|nr:cobalamin B12-binding domain-containing protein [Deltaproteobacteria bacterium]